MDNANELKEALDFLSPSALTYDEWILVGMGLKEAGLPVEAWEQWSARDGGRYHKGECAKKWASFHGGGGSPVTASSIFQLAYSSGWRGPAGHALDWNDDISAGTNHTDGQLVDPRWVEAHDYRLAGKKTCFDVRFQIASNISHMSINSILTCVFWGFDS